MATTTTTTTMTTKTETFDISGKWTLSRSLSDDPEEMMLLQNFGYFLRKAAKLGSMTIIFKHNHSDDPPTLALTVLPPGGFAKESRVRTLNGTKEVENHFIFGKNYLIWDKRKKTDESLDPYFREEEWIGDDLLLEDIFEGNDKFITYGVSVPIAALNLFADDFCYRSGGWLRLMVRNSLSSAQSSRPRMANEHKFGRSSSIAHWTIENSISLTVIFLVRTCMLSPCRLCPSMLVTCLTMSYDRL
jgi:hypothetical protein